MSVWTTVDASDVHAASTAWTSTVSEPVKASSRLDRVLATVSSEVAVVAVDHREACSHVAREVEGGDAGTKRKGRERVPEIVDAPRWGDPGCLLSRLPVSVAEVVQIEVAAPG